MGENTNRSEPFFDEDVDLVKLQFTDIFGQCKMVQMTRRQAEKAMKEGYAINRFALGGLQKAGIGGRGGAGVSDGPERECGIVLEAGCINVSGPFVGFRAGKCSARDLPGLQCGWDASWTDSRHILQETVNVPRRWDWTLILISSVSFICFTRMMMGDRRR